MDNLQDYFIYIYIYIKFSVSLMKELFDSEISLNKKIKCLFSYVYTLKFTVKGFKVIYENMVF